MPIPIIVLTNGRPECISKTIPSVVEHLHGAGAGLIVDDSGDDVYRGWLSEQYAAPVIPVSDGPCGYWRAMRRVWEVARDTGADFYWLHEDDFVLQADVDVEDLAGVLDAHPYLTQIALLRQPWFANEHAAGGLIPALEQQGQTFTETTDGVHTWIEHRACFTGNPTLIPRRTFERDWPEGDWSESRFGRLLFRDPAARGAYWGRRTDPPRVEHIGHERTGTDY
ncbi:glycosyltransferase family 2 protein [Spirillospora sp. NBC_01491]|uniref:glycosyltransferase family 2 protein n=1 Tax=Spirillospora sp. NBC_01491 TaxID=2976007 RepID=UPI002E36CF47|nr:hypothetical protein [Spirillospora sp. NBC_01491]